MLGALHKSPRTVSTEDVALLVSLAGHVAVALDRTNLVGALKARLTETETLLTVSRAVGSTLDLTETMRRVARETCRALEADMAGAFLADPDQKYLRPIAGYHVPKHQRSVLLAPMVVKGKPIGALFMTWWEQKHDFTSEELRLVAGISRQAALAIDNAQLYQQVKARAVPTRDTQPEETMILPNCVEDARMAAEAFVHDLGT